MHKLVLAIIEVQFLNMMSLPQLYFNFTCLFSALDEVDIALLKTYVSSCIPSCQILEI